jgi:hypothetical protein
MVLAPSIKTSMNKQVLISKLNFFFTFLNLNSFLLLLVFCRYPNLVVESLIFKVLVLFTLFFHIFFGFRSIFKDYSNNPIFSYLISLLFAFLFSSLIFIVFF